MTRKGWNIWQKLLASAGFVMICLRLFYPVRGFIKYSGGGGYYILDRKITVVHLAVIFTVAAICIWLARTKSAGWRLPAEHRGGISIPLWKFRK
jgi:hypothetical protein